MHFDTDINPRIWTLFVFFSRIEYALTRSNGFVQGKAGSPARGDWEKFALRLGQDLFDGLRADPATSILWRDPPGQWIVLKAGCTATWQVRVASEELRKALEPVRWVRNCVIHGESQDIVFRYIELVEASISVLRAAMEECEKNPELSEVLLKFKQARARSV